MVQAEAQGSAESETKAKDGQGQKQQIADINSLLKDFEPAPPTGQSGQPQGQPIAANNGKAVGDLLQAVFFITSLRRGNHWALTDEEAQALGSATDAVIVKYAPNIEVGPEAALVAAAGGIVIPRLLVEMMPPEESKEDKGAKDGDQSKHPLGK